MSKVVKETTHAWLNRKLEKVPEKVYAPDPIEADPFDHFDDAPPAPFNPNLKMIEAHLVKVPLDTIGREFLELTYGDMMDLAEAIKKVDTSNVLEAISADTLAQILHRFGKSRVKEVTKNED